MADYIVGPTFKKVVVEESGSFLNPLLWKANLFYGSGKSMEENFNDLRGVVLSHIPYASITTQIRK